MWKKMERRRGRLGRSIAVVRSSPELGAVSGGLGSVGDRLKSRE